MIARHKTQNIKVNKNIYKCIKFKIYLLLQVGSGSNKKVPVPNPAGQKSPDFPRPLMMNFFSFNFHFVAAIFVKIVSLQICSIEQKKNLDPDPQHWYLG